MGESLKMRGVARTWNHGGRTKNRQRVMLRELFSRQKNDERKKFCEDLDKERMRRAICSGVAKQLVNKNIDVVRANCVKDSEGKIVEEEDKLMEVWKAYYDGISKRGVYLG